MTPRFKRDWNCPHCVLIGQTPRMDVWYCPGTTDFITLGQATKPVGKLAHDARKYEPVNRIVVAAKLKGIIP